MSAPTPIETALVVPVPAADEAVEEWRFRLDPTCVLGMPAHITVLYPFIAPEDVDRPVLDELADLFSTVASFGFELTEVRWFDEDVVWLHPKPDEPFRRLTQLIVDRFPDFPPYQGAHAEVVPHLTIARACPMEDLRGAADAVARELPIRSHVDCVWLMSGSDDLDSWTVLDEYTLDS